MSSYPTPKHGKCDWTGCKFEGEVRITSDYQYLCPNHMNIHIKGARLSSANGKVLFLEGEIRRFTVKLAEAKAELPKAQAALETAKLEFKEAQTWNKLMS